MRKLTMMLIGVALLAQPALAGDKGLMGALLGAGAGAAIGHAVDRTGGSGKGAAIGAIGGYIIGSQMDKSEQKARQEGRAEARQSAPAPASGSQIVGHNCTAADDYVRKASATVNTDDKVYFLERAVKLCPEHAQAHNDLGVAYYTRNGRHDRERARSEFNEALRINPDYTVARDNLRSM